MDWEESVGRRWKDKVINGQVGKLIKWVEEWGSMNGTKEGDREREIVPFTGRRRESVIDYAIDRE